MNGPACAPASTLLATLPAVVRRATPLTSREALVRIPTKRAGSHALTCLTAGSSSGSAVAVSANIVPVSFGTETDTSVIWPAMTCGIVGIKPTVGLTSRAGVIPISETQDSVGSYGRTVSDAVRALDAIVGEDEDDRYTTQPHRVQEKSYTAFLVEKTALKCANFGLPMKRFWELAPQPQRKVVEQVLELLKEAGAQIIPVEMPCAEERIAQDGEWDWYLLLLSI